MGWTATGEKRMTRTASHSFTGDLGVPVVGFHPPLALVSSSSLDLRVIPGTASTLTAKERVSLRDEAQRLWARAVKYRQPDDSAGTGFELGESQVLDVPGAPGLRTVFFPMSFGPDKDTRGSFFFLLDRRGTITFGRFGHGEWSPGVSADEVARFVPLFFFRIGSDPTTYLLADYSEGWESWGLVAVIDPIRARVVAR